MAVTPFNELNMQMSIRTLIGTFCRCHTLAPLKTDKLVIKQKELRVYSVFLRKTVPIRVDEEKFSLLAWR